MTAHPSPGAAHRTRRGTAERTLVLLAVGSGAAALVYEIVFLQLLELFIGSSAVSVAILLGTFMGGLCLGSLAAPRWLTPGRHPLRAYAVVEIAIGLLGLLLVSTLPAIGRGYARAGADGGVGLLVGGLTAAACLLPSTIAMGATLPILARWIERTPTGVAWLGLLYAGNLAGGVVGCLAAGFYLLRVHGLTTAAVVAAALNAAVAGISWWLAGACPAAEEPLPEAAPGDGSDTAPPRSAIHVTIAISGFCALSAEVVWTRMLGLLLGPTVYTFSIILAVFLTGLGAGGAVGSLLARRTLRPLRGFGWCQLLLVPAIWWTSYLICAVLPYWRIAPSAPLRGFAIDLGRALLALLPPTLLWGASFPLALRAASRGGDEDQGHVVGGVYASNTAGAILGALGTSLLLVGTVGSRRTEQAIMMLSAFAGVLAMVDRAPAKGARSPTGPGVLWPLVPLGLAAALSAAVVPIPGVLVAYGKHAANWVGRTGDLVYVAEGMHSFVAVSRLSGGVLAYHNAGKIQASSQPQDMRLQRLLGHVSTLIPATPRDVFVIGCGAGVTAGAISLDPRVGRETIVEIEPLVPRVVSTHFRRLNFDVVNNPKVQIRIDDARHALLTTDATFDVITSDPFDPWVRGAAVLYTTEFFAAAKARLNPGGIVTMWVPLYTTTLGAVQSQMATFFSVFPDGFVLGNPYHGKGNDLVLVGQRDPSLIDLDAIERRLERPDYAPVMRSLAEVGIRSAADLVSSYAGRAADLRPWLAGAPLNRDGNLRLQYLAGLGLNTNEPDVIYRQMLRFRRPPDEVFSGSGESRTALERGLPPPR